MKKLKTLLSKIILKVLSKNYQDFILAALLTERIGVNHMPTKEPFAVFMNDYINSQMFLNGIYEKNILTNIQKLFPNGRIFLDIGANIGVHSCYLSGNFDSVLSYEPVLNTFDLLAYNTRRYPNIKKFNFGLSDREHVAQIKIDHKNYGASSIKTELTANSEKIQLKTLNSLLSDDIITQVDFIKIDVEGHEINVLKGMTNILEKGNATIGIEYKENQIALKKFLEHYDYKYFYNANNFNLLTRPNQSHTMVLVSKNKLHIRSL